MAPRRPDLRLLSVPAPGAPAQVDDDTGGPLTFADLYARYWRYVARIAHRMLGRDSDIEDLLQEVFLIALERLPPLHDQGAVRAWLGAVTVRRVARLLRWRRVRAVLHLDAFEVETVPSQDLGPEQRNQIAYAYRVLDRLPTNHRIAWVIRHLEEEPLERVAQMCGCSLATAKRWIGAAESRMLEHESHV